MYCPNNMAPLKRSNMYCSTDMFVPLAAIYIARTICHRLSAAIYIGRPICLRSSAAICIDRSVCHRWRAAICIGQPICHPESAAICNDCTNMPPSSIRFTIHIEIHIVLTPVILFSVNVASVNCNYPIYVQEKPKCDQFSCERERHCDTLNDKIMWSCFPSQSVVYYVLFTTNKSFTVFCGPERVLVALSPIFRSVVCWTAANARRILSLASSICII